MRMKTLMVMAMRMMSCNSRASKRARSCKYWTRTEPSEQQQNTTTTTTKRTKESKREKKKKKASKINRD